MIRFLVLCLGLLISISVTAQKNKRLFVKYERAVEKGKWNKAERILSKIAKNGNDDFIYSLQQAQLFYGKSQFDSAVYYVSLAIGQYSHMPTSSAQKGFMISRQELYRESIKICNKAIAIKPNSSYYLATRGVLKMETNQLQSAIYDFSKSLNIDSSDAIVFYNRGLCHRRMLHIDSAIADYKSCIRRDSNYAHALLNMGYAYMYKHDYEKAINLYTKALTKDSNLKSVGFTLNNIGYAYLKLENYKSALFYVNQSIKTYPINPYAYRNLALIQLAQNDSKQACKSLDKSIELGFVQQYGDEVLELKAANCR